MKEGKGHYGNNSGDDQDNYIKKLSRDEPRMAHDGKKEGFPGGVFCSELLGY